MNDYGAGWSKMYSITNENNTEANLFPGFTGGHFSASDQ